MRVLLTGGLLFVAALATPAWADDAGPETACRALAGHDIPASAIGRPTGGVKISKAEPIAAGAPDNPNGAFCQVVGAIKPVDPTAPDINFEVNLPEQWNGKALQMGGAGYNGSLVTGLLPAKFQRPDSPTPLAQGFVTLGSDSGHQSRVSSDGSFGLNDEALANFGGDQIKKTHDVALELVKARYGRAPTRFYFHGSSQGGHEGFLAIQRWPADYDGVVAIHPVYNFTALQLDGNALARRMYGTPGAWLDPAAVKLVGDATAGACDELDGARDGLISHVAGCLATFRLKSLQCPTQAPSPSCLTAEQIRTVEAIGSRYRLPFRLAGGVDSFAPWPILVGADWSAVFGTGTRPKPSNPPQPLADFGLLVLSDPMVRFMVLRDPNTDTLLFDPARHRARIAEVSRLIDASEADISAFRRRGGKLILMHGTVDSAVPPANTVDYYERMVRVFGRKTLDEFVRFYLAPGFGHGTGPFVVGWDSLGALDAWVESGTPPGPQTVVDTRKNGGGRTRPLCLYPAWPKLTGADIDKADSFTCVTDGARAARGGRGRG